MSNYMEPFYLKKLTTLKYPDVYNLYKLTEKSNLFKEFTIGENKILVINPGHNIMSPAYHENIFVLTKEAKRDIKLNLILNL